MPAQSLLAAPALFQLAPPYERFEAIADVSALDAHLLADGTVLVVEAGGPVEAWTAVAALVPRLRAEFPAAPVVLRVPRAPEGGHPDAGRLEWVRRAGALHVRAVLSDDEPPGPVLRRALTDETGLSDEVAAWLPLRVPAAAPAVLEVVRGIVRLARGRQEVGVLLRELGHAERTVRTWCRRDRLPGPGAWLGAAHAMRAALRLQAGRTPLLALAVECGYSDHSSLSRQCLRLFGVRPGAIRRLLGWEWLLDRWLGRVAV